MVWAFQTPGSSLLVLGSRGACEGQFVQRRVSGISSPQNDILRPEGETDVTTVETGHVVASQRASANPEFTPQVHVSSHPPGQTSEVLRLHQGAKTDEKCLPQSVCSGK